MRKILILSLIVLAAVYFILPTFASAQLANSPWPVFHGNPKLTGQSPYDTSKVNGTIKWKFKTEGGIETSPVIGKDGAIYIIDHKCNLYAIDSSGKEKWKFNGGEPVYTKEWNTWSCSQSTPAIAQDGTIYALTMAGNFFAVSPKGKEKWRYPIFTFKNSWSSPAIGKDGTIYVSSEAYPPTETGKSQERPGYIYALNPDGTKKWEFTNNGAGGSSSVAAVADDGTVYLPTGEFEQSIGTFVGKLFAFNPDGTIKWKFWPKNSVFEGSVAIGKDGTIYFGVKGADDPRKANFYAITADGKEKWKFPLTQGLSITPALADDGTVYFGDWGGTFYALTSDGKEKWRVETPGGKETYESLSSSPAIGKDGTIYFGSIANAFFAYTSEGKEKWKISLDESGVVSAPAIGQDGTVYFAPTSGQLIAVGEGAGTETSVTTDNLTLYLSIAAFLLAAVFILIIVLHRRRPVIIIIFALLAVGLLTFGGLQIAKMVKSPPPNQASNEDNIEECPKNVYQKDAEKYYISGKQSEERIDLSDENLKWIKENCKETVWPGQRQESEQNKNQESDKAEKEINCPRRVYGAPDSGYYGIYGMNQRDLTTEEFKWARQNCPGTIWPEDMQKGYRGD